MNLLGHTRHFGHVARLFSRTPMFFLLSNFFRGQQIETAEAYLVLCVIAFSFALPRLGAAHFGQWERAFARLAQRRRLAVILVGAAALAARAIILPILPVPVP